MATTTDRPSTANPANPDITAQVVRGAPWGQFSFFPSRDVGSVFLFPLLLEQEHGVNTVTWGQ